MTVNSLFQSIFSISNHLDFNAKAGEIFLFQSEKNAVYRQYVRLLGKQHVANVQNAEFPLLPVSMFKTHNLLCEGLTQQTEFLSSTTTGQQPSRHPVADMHMYTTTYLSAFRLFYNEPNEWCILALLPSYLERDGSSLIEMCKGLMEVSAHPLNGFFLNDTAELMYRIKKCADKKQKVLLIGVTFALLELADTYREDFSHVTIMETGGMKGRRKEITREEMHAVFKKSWNTPHIHSEYGMTEMFSQCYALKDGRFLCPPWVKVIGRQPEDLLSKAQDGQTCVLGIMDLANTATCSFLLTNDLGKVYADGSFEVLGRMDNAEIRGCNLMVI